MTSRVGTCVASIAIAVTLVACSSSSSKSSSADPTTTSTGPTTPTTTVRPASTAELEHLIVTEVPDRFDLQPDDVGDTGPSDLAKAIRDDGSPGAGKALRAEGFVRGYQQLWVGPDDAEIIVFVYQFATPAGAKRDFIRERKALLDQAPPAATHFSVGSIPRTAAFGVAGTSGDVSAAIVLFTTGPYNAQVIANGPVLAGLQARATKITQDQIELLS